MLPDAADGFRACWTVEGCFARNAAALPHKRGGSGAAAVSLGVRQRAAQARLSVSEWIRLGPAAGRGGGILALPRFEAAI